MFFNFLSKFLLPISPRNLRRVKQSVLCLKFHFRITILWLNFCMRKTILLLWYIKENIIDFFKLLRQKIKTRNVIKIKKPKKYLMTNSSEMFVCPKIGASKVLLKTAHLWNSCLDCILTNPHPCSQNETQQTTLTLAAQIMKLDLTRMKHYKRFPFVSGN